MTARRSKPSFASLLRRAAPAPDIEPPIGDLPPPAVEAPPPGAALPFEVDPARVRLWPRLGPAVTTADACAAIARDGQAAPVIVRPVFDDEHFEYEAISAPRIFAAVRRLREADSDVRLLVQAALVDDDGAAALAAEDEAEDYLPGAMRGAFGGTVPRDVAATLRECLDGPLGPAILATAAQVARAQTARRDDGLPPYPAVEVMRLLDAVGESPPAERLALTVAEADARSVTFRLAGERDLTPEALARAVKAMIDGAAGQGFAVEWGKDPRD